MKLSTLFEAQKILRIDQNAKDFLDDIEMEMEKVADSFAHEVKSPTTRAAAPDTTKFRAHVGGMIQVENNVHVHGGQYGSPKTYKVFLKIGGGIDHKVATKIKEEVVKRVAKLVDDQAAAKTMKFNAHLYCDDMVVIMGEEDGSNWGGIGFYPRKYSSYEEKQLDAYDLGD